VKGESRVTEPLHAFLSTVRCVAIGRRTAQKPVDMFDHGLRNVCRSANSRCYTKKIVIRRLLGALLVTSGLWIPFHTSFLSKLGMAQCQSACMPSCCMHGGMCPMMARYSHRELKSSKPRPAGKSHSAVGCSCSLSHPGSFTISQANFIYARPVYRPISKLTVSVRGISNDFLLVPAVDPSLPDPPPKALSS